MPPYHVYRDAFLNYINALPPGETVDVDKLLEIDTLPKVRKPTKRDALRKLIDAQPDLLTRITGFVPQPSTIIHLTEKALGDLVTERVIAQANEESRRIVLSIAGPAVSSFVKEELAQHISGNQLSMSLDVMMKFLVEPFSDFLRAGGNSLASIAGRVNEELLARAMKNAGMSEGSDYTKTGKDMKADIVVHTTAGTKDNLGVEVKSYHARERLLRGLDNVATTYKVGAGFFKAASEFGATRARAYETRGASAIYMPEATLSNVPDEARAVTTNSVIAIGSRLYRPLQQFATDMKYYNVNGKLPKY